MFPNGSYAIVIPIYIFLFCSGITVGESSGQRWLLSHQLQWSCVIETVHVCLESAVPFSRAAEVQMNNKKRIWLGKNYQFKVYIYIYHSIYFLSSECILLFDHCSSQRLRNEGLFILRSIGTDLETTPFIDVQFFKCFNYIT